MIVIFKGGVKEEYDADGWQLAEGKLRLLKGGIKVALLNWEHVFSVNFK